jgi:excinuclease ABC subunit C
VPGLLHPRCGAPCVGYVSQEEYRQAIDGVIAFLQGRYREVETDLETRMHEAAEVHEFEQAAIERNRLQAVRSLLERQRWPTSRSAPSTRSASR